MNSQKSTKWTIYIHEEMLHSLAIKEMQIKATPSVYVSSVNKTIIEETNNKYW
jgi:hypothetical protein